jgi:hypothetical protein
MLKTYIFKNMEKNFEWIGSHPQKFKGGIQIVKHKSPQTYNILTPSPDFSLKSIDNKPSKRHFPLKLSPVDSNQRFSNRFVELNSINFQREKRNEIFMLTRSPNVKKKNLTSKLMKFKNLSEKRTFNEKSKSERDQIEVLKLDDWEEQVLRTCINSPQMESQGFNSRTDRCAARLSQIMRNKLFC